VLRLFLHATSAGLFELRWELMCPDCRVPKAETGPLAELPVQFHCDTCGITYDSDFDQRVELRFSVHPAIRRVSGQMYCIGEPLRMPHTVAQQYLRPHVGRRIDLTLTGPVQLRTVRAAHRLLLTPVPAGTRARDITLTYSSGRWAGPHSLMRGDSVAVPSGSHLVLRNQTEGPILAAIEDLAWTSEATSAAQVTTMQEFRDLFSSEILAPQQQLAVSQIAFLFSDLKGSTQLYEGIGDAAAYSRVNRHFDFIRQAVSHGGGSIIKTMGDGVMCAFHRLDDALATAIELQAQVAARCQQQDIEPPLALKVGVHHGPAIAMTANEHLDYFGRTVNLAARLAGQSRGSDVVVLREVLDQANQSLFKRRDDITIEPFTTKLRGLTHDQRLARLHSPGRRRPWRYHDRYRPSRTELTRRSAPAVSEWARVNRTVGCRPAPQAAPVPAGTPVHGLGHGLRPADQPRRHLYPIPPPQTRRVHHRDRPRDRLPAASRPPHSLPSSSRAPHPVTAVPAGS
jgi:adenylate cyclase